MTKANEPVTIVNRGRGPQLSNSRITVQHLLPMFKEGASDAEISRWYPQISQSELDLLRQYYLDHTEEVLALEREIDLNSEEERKRYPRPPLPTDGMTPDEKRAWRLQRLAEIKRQEGDHMTAMKIVENVTGSTLTIELPPEFQGRQVEIQVRVLEKKQAWGEGIRRCAGIVADDPEFDSVMEAVRRERKQERPLPKNE